ncbi:MAG: UbiH/UbiF/VisC/COQ6 family ubiquinone biosynthesis hydroxylase [Proteobacteria bacterium]|nr:UbiH/UbiF/VisC/COQ6 family ubiquinone biosynthesis hydroxylase [Pseudomonadota bacterium]
MNSTTSNSADIAIVGAGIVGLCASLLLARAGFKISIIDPLSAVPSLPEAYDLRTYALTPASLRMFKRLNVVAELEKHRICEFHGMQVWDASSKGAIEFSALALGRDCLGAIVEHANLIRALHLAIGQCEGIRLVSDRVIDIAFTDPMNILNLERGARIHADLVLGCDGANSPVRQLLGVDTQRLEYVQHALVCNVNVEHPHTHIARQRFLPNGPIAFLPLADTNSCAVVWSTSPEQARFAHDAPIESFEAMLASAFDYRLGNVRLASERMVIPLQKLHSARYVINRAILLGDAAHVVHPLAGQGLNLGLMDAAALAQCLGPHEKLTLQFPGAALRQFERMRRGENFAMLSFTDQINKLFRLEHRFIKEMRGTGMCAFDRFIPLKHWIMLRAMGDYGDVPSIASR